MGSPAITDDAVGITSNGRVGSAVESLIGPPPVIVEQIPKSLLNPSPDNPADRMTDQSITELAESITSVGILEPLIVARAAAFQSTDDRLPLLQGSEFVVIAGHRRLAGAHQAYDDPQQPLPCIVRDDLIGADADVAMAVENAQREDHTPIQEAEIYKRLEERHGKSQRDIAQLVGKNQSHISKRLALLKLPDDIAAKLGTDQLSIEDAVEISKVSDDPKVLAKVMNRPSYQSIKSAADQATREHTAKDNLTAAKKKAKDNGLRVVAYPRYGWNAYGVRDTLAKLSELGEAGLDVKEHIHSDCHAIAIGLSDSYQGRKVQQELVCTDPSRHPQSAQSKKSKTELAAERKKQRDADAATKRREARLEIVRSAIGKPDAATERVIATLLLTRLLEESFDVEEFAALGFVLGIDAPAVEEPEEDQWGGRHHHQRALEAAWSAAIGTYVAAGPVNVSKAFLAAAFVQIDVRVEDGAIGISHRDYFEWLTSRGHKPTGREVDVIKLAKPPAVDERACRICGCTLEQACTGGCSWVEFDLCSTCEGAIGDGLVDGELPLSEATDAAI